VLLIQTCTFSCQEFSSVLREHNAVRCQAPCSYYHTNGLLWCSYMQFHTIYPTAYVRPLWQKSSTINKNTSNIAKNIWSTSTLKECKSTQIKNYERTSPSKADHAAHLMWKRELSYGKTLYLKNIFWMSLFYNLHIIHKNYIITGKQFRKTYLI